MAPIVDALCRVDRPASILAWKLSRRVQALLTGLACGDIPLTHQGLDEAGTDRQTAHLRSLLEHTGTLAARDEPLARFERWLADNSRRSPSRPRTPRWSNSPRGITCADYARHPCPDNAPMPPPDTPNKTSPRPSSSLPGCTPPINAP